MQFMLPKRIFLLLFIYFVFNMQVAVLLCKSMTNRQNFKIKQYKTYLEGVCYSELATILGVFVLKNAKRFV